MGISINFKRLAIDYGQWQSIRKHKAIDASGVPIPWYTYPAIEYLRSFDFKDCDVFEFGAGNSSLFWASRSQSVTSVEDDSDWFKHVNATVRNNQLIINCILENDYVESISQQGKLFNIIIVDGKWRRRCVEEAIKCLQNGGMIVLDNSDRKIEIGCSKFLREQGFFQIDFSGFGPINEYCWTTSIFIKTPTTLQLSYGDPAPIGGLEDIDS